MTEKRFINDIDNGQLIDTKGELSTIDYSDKVDFYELWEFLNKLNDENERLKQREERLLCEIEDFQELLAKNDDVCHKRVIDLIDDRIFYFLDVKIELLLNSDDDYRLEKLSFAIQNLRELRKELQE